MARMYGRKKVVATYVTPAVRAALDKIVQERGTTLSNLAREILTDYATRDQVWTKGTAPAVVMGEQGPELLEVLTEFAEYRGVVREIREALVNLFDPPLEVEQYEGNQRKKNPSIED